MNRRVFAVRDVKASEYLGLFLLKTPEEAQRIFLSAVKEDPRVSKFPRDYAVHELGTFDTELGVLVGAPGRDVTPYSEVDAIVSEARGKIPVSG